MIDRELLSSQFSELGVKVDDNLLEVCVELCMQYNLSEVDLVESWIAFSFSSLSGAPPTSENLKQFEKKELVQSNQSFTPNRNSSHIVNDKTDITTTPVHSSINNDFYYTNTPKTLKMTHDNLNINFSPATLSPDVYTPSAKYSSRKNAGQIITSFGKSDYNWVSLDVDIDIKELKERKSLKWKYLYETLRNNSLLIQDINLQLAQCILKYHNLPEPVPFGNQTDISVFIGRICPIDKSQSGCVVFQDLSCVEYGKFGTAELDFSQLVEFSLFQGQICAIRGTMTGNKLIVSEIFSSAPLPLPSSPKLALPLQIIVAAGPFTLSDNLSYEPLQDLIDYVKKNKPNILILIGPLLDASHTKISDGGVSETFEDYYTRLFKKFEESFKELKLKVCIISSSKDASNIPVYPTPIPDLGLHFENIKFYPDPSIFNINGLIVAVTATDTIFHIGKYDYSKIKSNRLGVLAGHLLNQQSFYPLYPPEHDTIYDVNLWHEHCQLTVTPHLFIAPSDLRCFAKDVNESVMVNPERLVKGMVGGTFACVEVQPSVEVDNWTPRTHISSKIIRI